MKSKLAIAATAILAALAAWANEYTTTTSLNADVECSALTLGASCDLDLNGHNLTYNGNNAGFVVTAGAKVTNSSATPATITIQSSDRIDSQFKNVVFSGNLVLHVKAQTLSNAGFQGVSNTHTGGTILENYNDTNDSKRPRFNTESPFGTGPLTLKCATIRSTYNSSSVWTLANSEVIVEGTGNYIANDNKEIKFTKFTMNDGAELQIGGNNAVNLRDCTVTIGSNTKLLLTSGRSLHLPQADYSGMEMSFHTTSTTDTSSVWFWGDGDLEFRALSTVLDGDSGRNKIGASVAGEHVLKVGGDDSSTTFYGNIAADTGVWNLTKVGTGTLTLAGVNGNTGHTTISNGVLEVSVDGSISATAGIAFNGGSLKYGEGVATDYSAKIASSADYIRVDTGTNNVTWAGNAITGTNPDVKGIVKSGDGELYLSSYDDRVLNLLSVSSYTNIIDAGVLTFRNARRNYQPDLKASIIGTGTLRLVHFEDHGGFRLRENGAFDDFYGTLDWADTECENAANGFMMTEVDSKKHNPKLPHAKFVVSANPDSLTVVMHGETAWNGSEANVTVGAFDHLYPTAGIQIDRSAWTLNINGSASSSYLNGPFLENPVYIVKSGVGKLAIGPGFSAPEGSSVNVNAGVFEIPSGMTSTDLPSYVTIASGVTFTGEGTFGSVDLSVNDVVVPDAAIIADKSREYPILTATSFANIGSSANLMSLLATLNADETKGRWRIRKVDNGNGTATLKCAYAKNGLAIIIR